MRYRFRCWCPTCYPDDPWGCFDGDMETSQETFATPAEAEQAGRDYTSIGIWLYEVIDEQDRVIVRPAKG